MIAKNAVWVHTPQQDAVGSAGQTRVDPRHRVTTGTQRRQATAQTISFLWKQPLSGTPIGHIGESPRNTGRHGPRRWLGARQRSRVDVPPPGEAGPHDFPLGQQGTHPPVGDTEQPSGDTHLNHEHKTTMHGRLVFMMQAKENSHHSWKESGSYSHIVGPAGLEPATSALSGQRSNRLSYGPGVVWEFTLPCKGTGLAGSAQVFCLAGAAAGL